PGQGALTEGLLGSGARLDVLALDQDLIPLLKLKFGHESRFSLHQRAALKIDFASLVEGRAKLRVVGHLPYHQS
ncbi:rRNA adenine N-6-methyltransferase family protein, partial [Pseudomonas aeruginosa]